MTRFLLFVLALFSAQSALAALPIQHWRTPDGVAVYFMQADAIPMLDVEVRFDAGGSLDKFAKIGVAGMTAGLLDAGAGQMNEEKIAGAFALIGAQRSAWANDDGAAVRLRTLLSEPELGKALVLMKSLMVRPRFDSTVVEREKQRTIQAIRNADNRAAVIAQRALRRLTYGEHPYGYRSTVESVSALSAQDLIAFHQKYYVRSRATVAMIGAINRKQAEEIAVMLVADLPAGEPVNNDIEPVAPLTESKEERIEYPGSQSHIYIGKPLMARGDPDYFALLIANNVLGGASFVSRLYQQVREKRGLAYSVSSGFSLGRQTRLFTIGLQTRREKTNEALRVVREVFADFVRDGPTEKEFKAARSNLTGGFAFRIDSNGKILSLLSAIGFHKLPLDYLDKWTDRINEVTLAQVRDALRRRLDPNVMVTVVVGAAESENSK